MKEPLIVDFLEQFLAEHHISTKPRVSSRAASIGSYISTSNDNRSPSSSSRVSVRLSQAELLEYSHHQQQRLTTHSSGSIHSPKRALSRPTSMASLDAALTAIEVGDTPNGITRKQQVSPTLSNITH